MLKQLMRLFRAPDSLTVAMQDLTDSRLQLLAAEEAESYARAMCSHHKDMIKRLELLLRDSNTQSKEDPMKK